MQSADLIQLVTRKRWMEYLATLFAPQVERRGRRREYRYDIGRGDVTIVYYADPRRQHRVIADTVPLLQLSPGGLMLRTYQELQPGLGVAMQLTLDQEQFALLGVIRHCTQTVGGFKVGVELSFSDVRRSHSDPFH
jgi:hypothetical protein